MYKTCGDCVRKHLAMAEGLLLEAHEGYPDHRWKAVGQLGLAEEEAINEQPEFAKEIREVRLVVMKSHADSFAVDIFQLIRKACVIFGEINDLTVDKNNSKIYDPVYLTPSEQTTLAERMVISDPHSSHSTGL